MALKEQTPVTNEQWLRQQLEDFWRAQTLIVRHERLMKQWFERERPKADQHKV